MPGGGTVNKLRSFSLSLARQLEKKPGISAYELNRLKVRLAAKMGMNGLPANPTVLSWIPNPSQEVLQALGIKPVRTISGVAPLAIMTKPIDCKHGTCIFCPGGEKSVFGSIPKSYTGHEPASMRGKANRFDSYLQTINRLYQLAQTGHSFQKIELIVMGGTFPSFDVQYRYEFITGAFKALNDFSDWFFLENEFNAQKFNAFFDPAQHEYKHYSIGFLDELQRQKGNPVLLTEQQKNETAFVRLVALCIETKPDYCKQEHIADMLQLGTTRVELGVQTLRDDILSFANRGHTVADSITATQLLKDSALKVTYHMMPGLPKSNSELDVQMFAELFENPDFCPDALKIYPCMVLPGTPLQKLFERGDFVPLSTEQAAMIIAKAKRFVPKWCRIQRIMRDIPTTLSVGGPKSNNLRQLVEQKTRELGIRCQCIRCREAGHVQQKNNIHLNPESATIHSVEYEASNASEVFISADDTKTDSLFGFCRVRIPTRFVQPEITSGTALVRELHVFGPAANLGESNKSGVQHRGLGKKLLEKAQETAQTKFDCKKLLVISGIGAREYYRKLGYTQNGVYMEKTL